MNCCDEQMLEFEQTLIPPDLVGLTNVGYRSRKTIFVKLHLFSFGVGVSILRLCFMCFLLGIWIRQSLSSIVFRQICFSGFSAQDLTFKIFREMRAREWII